MDESSPTLARSQKKIADDLQIALPPNDLSLDQDEEWFVVEVDGDWRRLRMHDYDQIFEVPGLYERIVYDVLRCDSPATIRALLDEELESTKKGADELRVLDLGAGNGMVGEELADSGCRTLVGVDIIPEAKDATERDRPGLYDNYFVYDMTALEKAERSRLESKRLNCLTCVAALGFGDIPTDAFLTALDVIDDEGWVAFNIKEDFLEPGEKTGFSRLVQSMIDDGVLEIRRRKRYVHRLGLDRRPLHYLGIVARKKSSISSSTLN